MNQAVFDPETVDLDSMLKRLHLANTRRQWQQFCQQAEQEQWSPRQFLAIVFAEEIAQRKNTRISREVRRAGFPFLKTIDDFDLCRQHPPPPEEADGLHDQQVPFHRMGRSSAVSSTRCGVSVA